MSSFHIVRAPALGLVLVVAGAVAACGGGLSDAEYQYCVNEAGPGELDAAAEALNIAPDANRDFETNPSRSDPTFQRICEYAWNARGRNLGQPALQPGNGVPNPTAPLDPQRSEDAPSIAPIQSSSPAAS